jgi:hypothetical protein
MTTPGVVTIPRELPIDPPAPTVIAAGLPKTIYPDPKAPDRLSVQCRDTIVVGDRITIHGLSTMRAGLIMTTAQVTVEP